ncbi:NACHT and WD repeat domain-containing protein [Nonomuraea sp. NPDC005650]|uniref:NACHT and WD repeat domain-containing protein n=1 Tax=Nonomuraea sp. NPDC005650 TaxID=3157045 RepID=UPI0033A1F13F
MTGTGHLPAPRAVLKQELGRLERLARDRTPTFSRAKAIDQANDLLAAQRIETALTPQTVGEWFTKGSVTRDFPLLWALVRVLLEHTDVPAPYHPGNAWWRSQHEQWKTRWEQARATGARHPAGPRPTTAEPGEGPYPGLAAFGPETARYFFGRGELSDTLAARVREQPALDGPLLVAGPSGAGKSSLLRVCLLPAADRSPSGAPVIFTPGDDPVRALAERFCGDDAPADVRRRLVEDPSSLRVPPRPDARPGTVIVDQFEEIFTARVEESERQVFIRALHAACRSTVVVIGMRADFFGHCAAYPELLPALQQPLIVGPMTTAQLREVIEEPARRAGIPVEAGLVDRLLDDLGATSTVGSGVLPLLAHCLLVTWKREKGQQLTLAGYRATGGIGKSLAYTAKDTLQGLDPDLRPVARRLLLRLVRPSEGTEDTRRRTPLTELLPPEGTPEHETVRQVLDAFVTSRLVTVDQDTAEITHEALIRAWPQLRAWIEEGRASLRVRHQLNEDAREWTGKGRDPAFLYRGTRLAIARDATEDDRAELGPEAQAFLEAGIRYDQAERDADRRRSRNRTVLSAALAILLLIATGTAATAIVQGRALNERAQTISRQLYQATASRLAGLAVTMRRADPITAKQLSVAAASLAPDSYESRNALLTLYAQPELYTYRPPGVDESWRTDTDRAGRLRVYVRGNDVKVADVDARRVIRSFIFPGQPLNTDDFARLRLSDDGKTLALPLQDGTVVLLDTATGQPLPTTIEAAPILDLVGDHLLIAKAPTLTSLWDTSSGKLLVRIPYYPTSAEVTPDQRQLITTHDADLDFWDLRTGRRTRTVRQAKGAKPISQIAFSPDGELLALVQSDGLVTDKRLGLVPFNRLDPARIRWRTIPTPSVPAVDEQIIFSSTGRYVSFNGAVWDTRDILDAGAAVAAFDHPIFAYAAAKCVNYRFGPGDRTLRCHEDDSSATRVVSLGAVRDPVAFGGITELSDDGTTLVVDDAGQPAIWDPITMVRRNTILAERRAGPVEYRLSPDGRLLASMESDGNTYIWDVATGRRKAVLRTRLRSAGFDSVAFSPDGGTLAVLTMHTSRNASLLTLWDIASQTPRASIIGRPAAGQYGVLGIEIWDRHLFFNRDGRTIISASDQGIVDASTGERVVPPDSGMDRPVALSPAGVLADFHNDSGKLTLRNSRSLQQTGQLSIGGAPAAFSPDGRLLAVADMTDQIQLWDVATNRPVGLPFAGFQPDAGSLRLSSLNALAFTPDGSAVLSLDDHDRLRTHLIAPGKIRDALCAQFGALSPTDWNTYVRDLPYRNSCRTI